MQINQITKSGYDVVPYVSGSVYQQIEVLSTWSNPKRDFDWISNLFTAMDRKKKIRKIFNLPEEKLPF